MVIYYYYLYQALELLPSSNQHICEFIHMGDDSEKQRKCAMGHGLVLIVMLNENVLVVRDWYERSQC